MRAVTVIPGQQGSVALTDMPEPPGEDGPVLVGTQAIGICGTGFEATVDPGLLNRNMVLQNSVLFGSVNANRQHYELAAAALAQADPGWLASLITRRVPRTRWEDAYNRGPDDIKTVLSFPETT